MLEHGIARAGSGPGSGIGSPDDAAPAVGSAMEPGSVENLSIVYRSQDFLVVNKHWDVRIDSKTWRETVTLQKQLRYRFPELADPDTYYGFRVTKAYLALVRGHVQESRMTISYAIGKSSAEGRSHTMCIEGTPGCENPKPSLTELMVLEHGLYSGDPVSKVLLQPLTGRTHQLRVHCSAQGHPVVGDLTYGRGGGWEEQPFRMMLHALYLRVPTDVERVEACTPDPFVPALDACWSPHTLVRPLNQLILALRAAPDPEPAASGPRPHSPEATRPTAPETEAQRASCLQWLLEWALEPDS
ncbi:RNA pseudouridylate synthase domain-containing protein 1 [Echinops telfairi]|uniref:RNA pseudouridylate synthase domain-containing protein 1 n=1 Tax=Echinops telfairi TaxID=9371 RepID=A0ABM0IRN4_ECHTE|nr:RNA pseudouridylate synthase domain-containing protein 1 [Echinops telfairi]